MAVQNRQDVIIPECSFDGTGSKSGWRRLNQLIGGKSCDVSELKSRHVLWPIFASRWNRGSTEVHWSRSESTKWSSRWRMQSFDSISPSASALANLQNWLANPQNEFLVTRIHDILPFLWDLCCHIWFHAGVRQPRITKCTLFACGLHWKQCNSEEVKDRWRLRLMGSVDEDEDFSEVVSQTYTYLASWAHWWATILFFGEGTGGSCKTREGTA